MLSPSSPDSSDQERKKILLVEDNTETQLILKIYLRDYYDVEIAQTAAEALKKIRKNKYALIILDINLPGELDGNDVIKKVNHDPEYVLVPILVVTAYALKGDKEKYLAMGAKGYLSKPVEKKDILRIANELAV
ncbi:MAG TPA: response regulator [Ignavibacteriaceae bacterium]|nr:response regulator [Ignavibacteriaceae bacterium]